MSTLVFGNIHCKKDAQISQQLQKDLTSYCQKNSIGIHFFAISEKFELSFQLSDDFQSPTCDAFLAPIIYTQEGQPILKDILQNLNVLYGMLVSIFDFNDVDFVVLRFSYVEVDEWEYEICNTSLLDFTEQALKKYLENYDIPVVKFVIKRNESNETLAT